MSFRYICTHVSVLDESTAMLIAEHNGRITLINEDGYMWTDPSSEWRAL